MKLKMTMSKLLIMNAVFTICLIAGVLSGIKWFSMGAIVLLLIDNICLTHMIVKIADKMDILNTDNMLNTVFTERSRNAEYRGSQAEPGFEDIENG